MTNERRSNNPFDTLVSFFEGDARRGGDESPSFNATEETEAVVEPEDQKEGQIAEVAAEPTGFMGGFRIRNMFGGGEYVYIDELEEKAEEVEEKEVEEKEVEKVEKVARGVATEQNDTVEETIGDAVVEEIVAETPAKNSSVFPNIGDFIKPPSIEMPEMSQLSFELPELPKMASPCATQSEASEGDAVEEPPSSGSDGDANVVQVREWIRNWRERTE